MRKDGDSHQRPVTASDPSAQPTPPAEPRSLSFLGPVEIDSASRGRANNDCDCDCGYNCDCDGDGDAGSPSPGCSIRPSPLRHPAGRAAIATGEWTSEGISGRRGLGSNSTVVAARLPSQLSELGPSSDLPGSRRQVRYELQLLGRETPDRPDLLDLLDLQPRKRPLPRPISIETAVTPVKKARSRQGPLPPRHIDLPTPPGLMDWSPTGIRARDLDHQHRPHQHHHQQQQQQQQKQQQEQQQQQAPMSPLFFSHSSRQVSAPLPTFNSAEAAATMLTNLRDDPDGVTTVRLTRGSVSTASPSRSGSTTESASSRDTRSSLHVLHGIGVLELLDQDQRPVFMVDLLSSPLSSGPHQGLPIQYTNPALRRFSAIRDLLAAETDECTPDSEFVRFRAWVMSLAKMADPIEGWVPFYSYGGYTWTHSTVRRRFRFVSANAVPHPASSSATATAAVAAATTATTMMTTPTMATTTATTPATNFLPRPPDVTCPLPPLPAPLPLPAPAPAPDPPQIPSRPAVAAAKDVATSARTSREATPMASAPLLPSCANEMAPEHGRPATPDYFGQMVDPELDIESAVPRDDDDSLLMMMDVDEVEEVEAGIEIGDMERHHSDEFTRHVLRSQPSVPSFDWTQVPLSAQMDDHIRFARGVDWAATPLGPIGDWSPELRAMSNLVMGSPHPAAMYWGPDHIVIYNAAYIEMAGQKHPALMGRSFVAAWPEIWPEIEPVFTSARELGQATMKHENQLFMIRHGFCEETFFSWSVVPILDADGQVVGLYNPTFEHTRRRINERWMLLLREVGERTAMAKETCAFWPQVLVGLEYSEVDVPFALIYSCREDDDESDSSSLHSQQQQPPPPQHLSIAPQLVLEGALGVPEGHAVAPTQIDLRTSEEGFAPFMRRSLAAGGSIVELDREAGDFPATLLEGIHSRGFDDPCRTVVVLPIMPAGVGKTVVGFVIVGTNPRRPYDDDYKLFISLLSRQLTTSMASVTLFEEEIRRGQRAARLAALDRQALSAQLRLKTAEAMESESRFSRMAEFAPVGMFIADPQGRISYCNDMWWQISRHTRSSLPWSSESDDATAAADTVDNWMESVRDEDQPRLRQVWRRLVEQDRTPVTHEFRFKCSRPAEQGSGGGGGGGVSSAISTTSAATPTTTATASQPAAPSTMIDTWVLMSAYPERDERGALKLIFGCITDISAQKWSEQWQKQRKEEAVELKRQQENFIDITSHEMRNPLSAVLQSADEIANSIDAVRRRRPDLEGSELAVLLDECAEAAHTINVCASHQKRIVDDILTLSKLDSQLLMVTPVDVQPVTVLRRVLKIFESELNTHSIRLDVGLDQSYIDYGIDWVRLDPSRLQQVLINLMTNAIKFTQSRDRRSISVRLGASRDPSESGQVYIPPRQRLPPQPQSQQQEQQEQQEQEQKQQEQKQAQAQAQEQGQQQLVQGHAHHGGGAVAVANAVATDEGGWGTGEEINLHFTIADTGAGLDENEMKLLFQRFSQATPRTHVQYGGSGLGLFISRILTELQGGQIGVQSDKGVGSTFSFYIKSRRSEGPESEPGSDEAVSASGSGSGPMSRSGSRCESIPTAKARATPPPGPLSPRTPLPSTLASRPLPLPLPAAPANPIRAGSLKGGSGAFGTLDVLIVEDNIVNQKVLQKQLRNCGNNTHVANHGGEALDTLRLSRFWAGRETDGIAIHVVLLDLEMPVMDGMTCARRIRQLEREGTIVRHIPIIAVTAYARPEQIESAKAAGIDDVISKPFRIPELIPKIQELVSKYNTFAMSMEPEPK